MLIQPERPRKLSTLTLVALPTAVTCARSLVYVTLRDWKIGHLTEAASLIMDELITMAVESTGIPGDMPKLTDDVALTYIQARLVLLEDGRLIVEVVDQGDEKPAEGWQYYYLRGGGKAVWRDLHATTSAGLPRRVPNRQPAEPVQVMNDLALLKQVREGLENL